jgi:hypothetical protein
LFKSSNPTSCPERIVDDVGSAFLMGFVGGSIFHYVKQNESKQNRLKEQKTHQKEKNSKEHGVQW